MILMQAKVLLCEDNPDISKLVQKILSKEMKYNLTIAPTGKECLDEIHEDYDLIILDLNLPDMTGVDVLKEIKEQLPHQKVIIFTANTDIEVAVDCMRNGASNYIQKPFQVQDFLMTLESCIDFEKVYRKKDTNPFLKSKSPKMLEVIDTINRVSGKNISVMVRGESGTGKEVVARILFEKGKRNQSKFVAVNCPAIPSNLAESELFGHQQGAFTGATQDKAGKFEEANDGILFLDEIADLDYNIQSKLLRVLQEREIERLGSNKKIPLNIQLISATSSNLEGQISSGDFRLDLYYRVAEIEIKLPPLRERKEDLEDMVNFFALEYCDENHEKLKTFDPEIIRILKDYSWPGNIRELKSFVRRMIILCQDDVVTKNALPSNLFDLIQKSISKPSAQLNTVEQESDSFNEPNSFICLKENEKQAILNAIQKTGNNMVAAASLLGIGRSTLYRKMKKYGIR